MDGTAIVLCGGYYATVNGKTAHGLVRGTDRYRILGVVDPPTAGRDAGEVLDGIATRNPVFASLDEALTGLAEKPDYAIVGVATHGGRMTPAIRASLREAIERGLSVVNGLHEFASDEPELARRRRERSDDHRRPAGQAAQRAAFLDGRDPELATPRVAVLGTDCALGKRTTTKLLVEACRKDGLAAEWIATGQTGWLQGAPFGIVLDALPNDFVTGELEHAILSCARELAPEVIFLEGQSALRNPSGPCGSELILSGAARGVVLQHAPGRVFFEGHEKEGCTDPADRGGDRVDPPARRAHAGAGFERPGARARGTARGARDARNPARYPAALPLEEGVDSARSGHPRFLEWKLREDRLGSRAVSRRLA